MGAKVIFVIFYLSFFHFLHFIILSYLFYSSHTMCTQRRRRWTRQRVPMHLQHKKDGIQEPILFDGNRNSNKNEDDFLFLKMGTHSCWTKVPLRQTTLELQPVDEVIALKGGLITPSYILNFSCVCFSPFIFRQW